MTYPSSLDISRGIASGHRLVRQFGRNTAVGGTFVPVSRSGVYRTPQVAAAPFLRIRSGGNAADTANGAGARSVTLIGLDVNGDYITETIATAGASASALTVNRFLRLTDARVATSGTYATQTALSHAASINIEDAAGNLWATIQDTDIPRGDTEIGSYSVPRNRTLFITNVKLQAEPSNKSNIVMFERSGILQSAPPYDAMILIKEFPHFSGHAQFTFDPPIRINELTDVGFLAKTATSTTDVAVAFDCIEVYPT
jgi:hypothetical protein